MSQFRPVVATKRPTTVEAWRWDGTLPAAHNIAGWVTEAGGRIEIHPHENILVLGYDSVKPGEWVIRDQFGEFFPLPHDVYLTVYESPIPL